MFTNVLLFYQHTHKHNLQIISVFPNCKLPVWVRKRERIKLDIKMPGITGKYLQCVNFPKEHMNTSQFGRFCLSMEGFHNLFTNAQRFIDFKDVNSYFYNWV